MWAQEFTPRTATYVANVGDLDDDLATMESAITTELKGLKAEFEKVGISAQPVNTLINVSQWLHEQLPMLRRRHSAAVLLQSQGLQFTPGTHMLSYCHCSSSRSTSGIGPRSAHPGSSARLLRNPRSAANASTSVPSGTCMIV